jgi:hypothetical protein
VPDVVNEHGAALAGKVVIDAVNRMGAPQPDSRELIAAAAPSARYVRAFSTLGLQVTQRHALRPAAHRLPVRPPRPPQPLPQIIQRRAVHTDRKWLDPIRHTRIIPAASTRLPHPTPEPATPTAPTRRYVSH